MSTLSITASQILTWGMILIPLLGAFVALTCKNFSRLKLLTCLGILPFLCALALYPAIFIQKTAISAGFDFFLSGIRLYVDGLSLLFCLFTSLIWSLAGLYGYAYLRSEQGMQRYAAAWLTALAANLGLVLAEDLLTFFLFWEMLSLSAYLLIIHQEDEAAFYAGKKYLSLSLPGGILLLGGILILKTYTNSMQWSVLWQNNTLSPQAWWLAIILILLGLMVKAGLMPLHIWLPDAHPAAPTPASALLSGVMIKAGAYGMIRLAQSYLQSAAANHWVLQGQTVGYCLLWLGLVSMILGVSLALFQSNAKRLLAYHSISQMGYIVLGIGMCLYWGSANALLGSLYHVVNHALFKSSLFLIVGVIYWQTGKLNLKQLGGWYKLLPLLFGFALIASLGIAGIPPLNGYISKTLLHHELSAGLKIMQPHFSFEPQLIEGIFILTGAGTLASFIKFMGFIFLFPAKEKQLVKAPTPVVMQAPIVVLSILIVLGGIAPYWWLEKLLVPALGIGSVSLVHFWALPELSGAGISIVLGGTLFALAYYKGFFQRHWQPLPLVDYAYCRLGQGLLFLSRQIAAMLTALNNAVQHLYQDVAAANRRLIKGWQTLLAKIEGHGKCLQNRWQVMEEEVVCYCKRWEEKLTYKSSDSLQRVQHWQQEKGEKYTTAIDQSLQQVQHWPQETEQEILSYSRWLKNLPDRLLNLVCSCLKKVENWLISKAQNYKPLDAEERITPLTAVSHILVYFNRDLSLGLSLVLLVLLLFLLPIVV